MAKSGIPYQFLLFIVYFIVTITAMGQKTVVLDTIPENTPAADEIFISGDFEGWTGGQNNYRLNHQNGRYFIDLPIAEKTIYFKFTRGNWGTVETASDGTQLDNRSLSLKGAADTIHLHIDQWADFVTAKSTASDNVYLLQEDFDMSPLPKTRRIWIYLPENYQKSEKNYPVIYMQDGQNLFDSSLSYSGEWEVDETLDDLAESQQLETIVVGIDHGETKRIDEYAPWPFKEYSSEVLGDQYLSFIKDNLKPYIDRNYRTKSDAANTGIIGSSLGGLISFYAALKYSNTFGMAAVFSPSFPIIENYQDFIRDHSDLQGSRIYFMAGNQESEHMVEKMQETTELMRNSGFPEQNMSSKVVEGGKHNEKLWREEFEQALLWLFQKNTNQ